MEQLITTDLQLRRIIPSLMETVEGEATVLDRLAPFLNRRQAWLETYVTGSDDLPAPESWRPLARRVVALEAFADAAPSLDLVLSPNGFGVVSTSELAPASKERVERLISSLRDDAVNSLDALVQALHHIQEWAGSVPGRRFCSTLVRNISDVRRWHRSGEILDTFDRAAGLARRFEELAAAEYLGTGLMELMLAYAGGVRTGGVIDDECSLLLPLLADAEARWIDFRMRDQRLKCPDSHDIWHLIEPVMLRVRKSPRIFDEIWHPEMGDAGPEFDNDVPGAFYF